MNTIVSVVIVFSVLAIILISSVVLSIMIILNIMQRFEKKIQGDIDEFKKNMNQYVRKLKNTIHIENELFENE